MNIWDHSRISVRKFGGKEVDNRNELAQDLDLYITNLINLPDVGEFEMEGEGEIIKENELIFIECKSIMKGYESYDDQTWEPKGWEEVNEIDPEHSGKFELFKD